MINRAKQTTNSLYTALCDCGKDAMNFFHRKECIDSGIDSRPIHWPIQKEANVSVYIDSIQKLQLEFRTMEYIQSYLLLFSSDIVLSQHSLINH